MNRDIAPMEHIIRLMTDEGLRWDMTCNVHPETKRAMGEELKRRGKSLHGMAIREGGPFVPGMTWRRIV